MPEPSISLECTNSVYCVHYGKGSSNWFSFFGTSSDENEATQLLIDHGAKVNSTNKKGATPLIIAAVKGHHSVLRILANHPQIQLHVQVSQHQCSLV